MSETNKSQLKALKREILRTGTLIEQQNREDELKSLAKLVRGGERELDEFLPDVLELDPQRNDKLCEYYVSLFSQFEQLKMQELGAKKRGLDAHQKWLTSPYYSDPTATKRIASTVLEKIAISGVTAGIIWLGKVIVDNWPFGFNYSDLPSDTKDGS